MRRPEISDTNRPFAFDVVDWTRLRPASQSCEYGLGVLLCRGYVDTSAISSIAGGFEGIANVQSESPLPTKRAAQWAALSAVGCAGLVLSYEPLVLPADCWRPIQRRRVKNTAKPSIHKNVRLMAPPPDERISC